MRLLKLVETCARFTRALSEPASKYGFMQATGGQGVVNCTLPTEVVPLPSPRARRLTCEASSTFQSPAGARPTAKPKRETLPYPLLLSTAFRALPQRIRFPLLPPGRDSLSRAAGGSGRSIVLRIHQGVGDSVLDHPHRLLPQGKRKSRPFPTSGRLSAPALFQLPRIFTAWTLHSPRNFLMTNLKKQTSRTAFFSPPGAL
jgi:hypothetical protein